MKCRGHNTIHDDVLPKICCALLIILGASASSPNIFAAEWEFKPRLTVSETYTDNVRLGAAGLGAGGFGGTGNQQGGDFITQINPGILFTGVGRRFNLSTNYTMNNLIFAENSNFNRIRHQLNATATTEIIKDFFFIDGMARRMQQNASLTGPQAVDNTSITGNRIDIRTYNLSPYLRYHFKQLASTELRYTRGIVESNLRNGLRNSQRDSFQFSLNSGSAFRTLQWGLNYNKNIIHFTRTDREIKIEQSIANLRYNLTSQFALTATGGYENNRFGSAVRRDISAPSWTIGFFWAPTQRTDINLAAGKRFFGDTYRAEANHRTRLTTWAARYIEEVTTFNQQAGQAGGFGNFGGFGGGTGGIGGLDTLGALNSVNNGLFLQKRFSASVSLNGARNTLSFRIFNLSRKSLSSIEDNVELFGLDNALLTRNIKQTGVNARWNYKLSPLTNASFGASFVRFRFASSNTKTNNMIYNASLTNKIQPNLTGILRYRYIQRQGGSSQFGNLSANSITASLRMDF